MATYAIGDIQGCYETFRRLLERIKFSPAADRLWLVGDLVNRGPDSLSVLRWTYQNRDHLDVVLGNHDLHLLARAYGGASKKKRDTLEDVLTASDRDPFLRWLSHQPLLVHEGSWILVHAGIHPQWSLEQAEKRAQDVKDVLAGPDSHKFLSQLRRKKALPEYARLNQTVAVLTRMRMLDPQGELNNRYAGPPKDAPSELSPWFKANRPNDIPATILFGHWAALGLYQDDRVVGLDSACVWGDTLSAMRLEDRMLFQEPVADESIRAAEE